MHIHILGICGTFMAGVAALVKQSGHTVTGSDEHVYPPMSTQLVDQGIQLYLGFDPKDIPKTADCIIVGNIIRRGNPAMEYVLEHNIPYVSGPQWLAENILRHRWVLGVAGTHGKTTTASLVTWILEHAGLNPGFLIGGVPENLRVSARMGQSPFFVIEADEYDSAFFDKRSKFLHYRPKTLILNNLEFDHADIFTDLSAIQQQFHYLVRTVPPNGQIICAASDANLKAVLDKGCWTPVVTFGSPDGLWQAKLITADGSSFQVFYQQTLYGVVEWNLLGNHNVNNALAAIAASYHAGVAIEQSILALGTFKNVKRRLEIKSTLHDVTIYDDFAHHPTAIATTLAGLRAKVGKARIIAVLEFGSFTMRSGIHRDAIQNALKTADLVFCKQPELDWGLKDILAKFTQSTTLCADVNSLVEQLGKVLQKGDHVVVMSNSSFGGIHQKLIQALKEYAVLSDDR